MALPGEGSVIEQREVNETARHKWMTCRARADRWMEEEDLLQEEMRRVIVYLEWKSCAWSEKVGIRAGSCTLDIQHGVDAYARKQASIHCEIAVSFASQWLPYLKAAGYDTKWATELPWALQILSHETKLPKRFSVTPADTPRVLPTTDPFPGMEEPDAHKTRSKNSGSKGKGRCNKRSNDSDMDFGQQEQGSDEEWGSGDESEGYDGEDYDEDGEGPDNGAETNDELGFEYDDEYMT